MAALPVHVKATLAPEGPKTMATNINSSEPAPGGEVPSPSPESKTSPRVILIPMKIDAFLNYDPRLRGFGDPQTRAYLAPIKTPNFDGLQMRNSLVQHDIFEHLRDPPYMSDHDRYRVLPRRQGIYIHWSVPKMYRSAIVGSESAQEPVQQARKLGGYPAFSKDDDHTAPVFRPVPTRWIIFRSVRSGRSGKILVKSKGTEEELSGPIGISLDFSKLVSCTKFVVQGDSIRDITNIPDTEDLEVTSSPYFDPASNVSKQGQTFLGRTMRYEDWAGDGDIPHNTVPITVSQAADPFFADYQPQNGSVFSFFDDLSLSPDTVFSDATVSYTVMGYHVTDDNDPLHMDPALDQTPMDRLSRCQLKVNPKTIARSDDSDWLNRSFSGSHNMRALCHGSMFNVSWINPTDPTASPTALTYPADKIQKNFFASHPISVGTNPIDALFGWLRSTNDADGLSQGDIRRDLMKIQTLVLDSNDDVDSQLQAEDLLATNNFTPSAAGIHWHFKAPDETPSDTQPTVPTLPQSAALRSLNASQSLLNALLREQKRKCAELFSLWWTYVADKDNGNVTDKAARVTAARQRTRALQAEIQVTDQKLIDDLIKEVARKKADTGLVQAGAVQPFHMQRDPTLFIAGLSSKWPSDWNESLSVRLDPLHPRPEAAQPTPSIWPPSDSWDSNDVAEKVPRYIADAMGDVFEEARYNRLDPGDPINKLNPMPTPEYFMNGDRFTGENGWFPLFIEWEIEYYHIPFNLWTFAPQGPEARVGYGIDPAANISSSDIQSDYRVISGRCPTLPQAGATLDATLKQVFAKMNPNEPPLTANEQFQLLASVKDLDFSSTPMTGLTTQLITLMQGTHVTPVYFDADNNVQVLPEALEVGSEIGMAESVFKEMGMETSHTPFASLVNIPAGNYNPFKPCIHGQFRFSKLNIVDKFGQVVRGMKLFASPGMHGSTPLTLGPVYPCLGDSYSVESNADGTAKTVLPQGDKNCTFLQLPPSINQDARVNAEFISEDAAKQWRHMDEWENPVRGWLVINQANASLQVFTPDGQFIREYSITQAYAITRPFAADETLSSSLDPILKKFMTQCAEPGFVAGLFHCLSSTALSTQANPSSYAESMLSLLGRPVAFTAFGISLELADPPLSNQCTTTPSSVVQQESLTDYDFGVKIGDKDNLYDGLYGYFNTSDDLSNGLDIDFSKFHTYHPDPEAAPVKGHPGCSMPTNLTFKPFYPDPHAPDYAVERTKAQKPFIALIDPFVAVNIYTALLPIRQLKLPPWTVSNGISQIAAFFKIGPVLVPNDVPPFDEGKVVHKDYRLDDATAPTETGRIAIPNVGLGDWKWLQPYWDQSGKGGVGETKYNLLGVDAVGTKPGWEEGPYTVVEGFLQQKKPFGRDEVLPQH